MKNDEKVDAVAAALPHGYSADRLPSHLSDEFRFDAKTAPLCLLQGDLHTFAKREHCFMMSASPGTGSYTWLDRVWEFMNHKGYNASSETRPSACSSPK